MNKLQHLAFAFLVAASALLAATPAQAADGGFHVPYQEDQSSWTETVCASMTKGGCLYFREHEAGDRACFPMIIPFNHPFTSAAGRFSILEI